MEPKLTTAVKATFEKERAAIAKAAGKPESGETRSFRVIKAASSADLGVVTVIGAAIGDAKRVDKDDEFVEKADLISMAFDFCAGTARVFKANHEVEISADLVESWVGAPIIKDGDATRVLKADEALTGEMEVTGISFEPQTHWFASIRPEDAELVQKCQGASWSGLVTKTEVAAQ